MKKTILIIALVFITGVARGTLLVEDNFDYPAGDDITAHGWTHHSGTTGIIFVTSPGLAYSGYISSGIGNSADVDTTGYDDNFKFSDSVMTGTVYASFMLNVETNGAPTGYFLHLGPPTVGTSYWGRVWGQNSVADSFRLGISKSTETAGNYSSSNFAFNRTYLAVLKYNLTAGTLNDTVSLFVFETGVPLTEPATPTIGPYTNAGFAEATKLGAVCLRQYSATQKYFVDGIRVGTTWADVCPPTSTPFISVNPSALNFSTTALTDTSDEMSYTVSGSNLTAGITVTAPSTDFRVSLTSGSGYTNTVTIPHTGGTVPPTAVYVIFKPAVTEGLRSGNITNASAGAVTQNVAVSGTGSRIIVAGAPLNFGAVVAGSYSPEQTYMVYGKNLTEDVTITAPANFQVSLTSGSGFGSSALLLIDGDSVAHTTVYARFAPAASGTFIDSIRHSSLGAVSRYLLVSGRGVAIEPTVQASNIIFTRVNVDTMTVNWTRGNGTGCLVVARCESPTANVPLDGYFYSAADSFGQGSTVGTGHYVVYKGTGTSVKVKKLYGITAYHYAVFEYNGVDSCENYLTTAYPQNFQLTNSASGKISVITLGTAYSQNFNALDTVPNPDVLPQGWNFREEGSTANYIYAENNGALNTGNIYSYGMTDSVDRAFGGLQTSSLVPTVSAVFTNNSGGTLSAIDIGYWGELWRLGLQRYDSLKFELSTTAGIWTAYPQLNFVTPETTGAFGIRDGNNWLYRDYCWASLSGLSIPNGGDFRIRWLDANALSYDDGLAIDDISIIPFNGRTIPRIIYTSPYDTALDVAVNAPIKIGFSDTMNTASLTYTCSPNPGGWSASWNSPRNDTVTLTHSNFAYWTNYTFTLTQARDLEGFNFVAGPCANPFSFRTAVDPAAPPMYITIINVGQGDAAVIQSPTGKRVLIDAGDVEDATTVFNFIKDSLGTPNSRFLDYTFMSHFHSDHGGGLDQVIFRLDSLRVGAYDRGDLDATGTTYTNYLDSLSAKGWSAKRHAVTMGQEFDLGYGASIKVICFNGKTLSGDGVNPTDENNYSLGLLINYANKFKMVMCGDIFRDQERLLSPDLGGRISVLKANHHGSNTSNGLKWVTDLNPMVTVIPVGDGNSYGHVHVEARDSLLADPKSSKAAGDSNRLYRTELGSGAACVAGRDTALWENIHIEVTPNAATVFRIMNDGRIFPALAVELSQFAAMVSQSNSIVISWRTESENECYLWKIERSVRAERGFSGIGSVPGHGTVSYPSQYEFEDTGLPSGTYYYRLLQIDNSGKSTYYGPVSVDYVQGSACSFALSQSRPNPFGKGSLAISYSLDKSDRAALKIYNILGQEIKTLFDRQHEQGSFTVKWDGRDNKGRELASGIYYYRLSLGTRSTCKKITVIR
ncbi:Ig-like domain-containing protein [candidate division TA06 bacterium]|nr:Ig-like domain-containing protein [candidate division TA06 bacterium]